MRTISGESNWRLVLRREGDQITILRAGTPDIKAVLPKTLLGLPVTALGDRALAPDRQSAPDGQPAAGEETLLVTCGLPDPAAAWDNRRLQDLTLPETLAAVGDYALLNCSALKTLRVHGLVRRWGGGVLMNCRSLDTLHLSLEDGGETLAYFAGELSRELDVSLRAPGGTARLLFPEYTELYEENCPAHHFDYSISGAGYPYHHCFRQKRFSLKEYDALWRDFLGMEHDTAAALRLAWYRLRWPVELSDGADYRAFLRARAGEALSLLLPEGGADGLSLLLELTEPDREALSAACTQARESGNTAALAILLEERHRRFPGGMEKSFTL